MDKLIARYGEVFNMRSNEINEMIQRRELWDKYHLIEEATKAEITRGRLGNWESISPEKQQKAISIVAKDRFGMREDQIARLVEKPELRQQYERVKAAARNRVVELYGEKKWQSIEPKKIDRMVVSFANTDFNMPPEKIGEMIEHSSQYIRGLNGLPPEQRKKAIGELNSDYGKWVDWNKESEGQAEAAPEISRERQRESDLEL